MVGAGKGSREEFGEGLFVNPFEVCAFVRAENRVGDVGSDESREAFGRALLHPHDGLGEVVLSFGFRFVIGAEDDKRRCWRACRCVACRCGDIAGRFDHGDDAVGVHIFAIGERIFSGL